MHICFLTGEYPTSKSNHGGIGTFVKFLAEELIKKKNIVSVVGIYKQTETISLNGVTIYKLNKSNWKFAKFHQHQKKIEHKLKEIHRNSKIDIVEGSELNFAFFPKKTPYKKVIRLHGGHHFFASEENRKTNFWKAFQEKRSFRIADNYIAVTNYVGEKTKQLLKYNFSFCTIYNSIDFSSFYESDINKEEPFHLLFIGTVCEKKGIESLILAMPMLLKEFPHISLDIVGRDWIDKSGSYTEYLKSLIGEILKNKINFLGSISYELLPKVIEKAHICVYPSLAESFGLTLIEAMLMGKKVVASNIKPFLEITKGSSDVEFFKVGSPEDIFKKISDLLKNKDVELRQRNREFILKKFSTEKIIKENVDYYKSLIGN